MATVVEQHRHLDAVPSLAERGPGKKGQAQLDDAGVEAEQRGLNAELVVRGFRPYTDRTFQRTNPEKSSPSGSWWYRPR